MLEFNLLIEFYLNKQKSTWAQREVSKRLYADWNDVSDDESDEEHHQHEEEHKDEVKDVPQELPVLNKIVSSPLPDKKNAGNFFFNPGE